MGQNLASVHFSSEQWAAVDAAIDALERAIEAMLVGLSPGERRRLVKMGPRSESFCRGTHVAMRDNLALLPPCVDPDAMARKLATHDALAERLMRIGRLLERMVDTDIALGSDVMVAALEGYAFFKRFGASEGLNGLRRALGKRFEGQGPQRGRRASAAANAAS